MLSRIVFFLATFFDLKIRTFGSFTHQREDLAKGLEPDECFYLASLAAVKGKLEIDLMCDPPPDLSLEIDITSSSLDRMAIYAALKVPEVWRFDGVNVIMAVATLVTNKPYLGWERHAWDPILLGILLAGTALALRRWLSGGADGQRNGFTPRSLVASADRRGLGVLAAFAGAAQPFAARTPTETPLEPGRGGRSGGAGGGAGF